MWSFGSTCFATDLLIGKNITDGWLAILRPLIAVISGRLVGDNERLCVMASRLRLKRSSSQAGLKSGNPRLAGMRLFHWATVFLRAKGTTHCSQQTALRKIRYGWLLGFNGLLGLYLSLYRAISQRGRKKRVKIDDRKKCSNIPSSPTASEIGLYPTIIQISWTLRHWKFTQRHRTSRPHPKSDMQIGRQLKVRKEQSGLSTLG